MNSFLPLIQFFYDLQEVKEFSLGVDDYRDLMEVLQTKNGLKYFEKTDKADEVDKLLKLCKLLWLKPGQNEKLFDRIYQTSMIGIAERSSNFDDEKEGLADDKNGESGSHGQDQNDFSDEKEKSDHIEFDAHDFSEKKEATVDKPSKKSNKKDADRPIYLNFEKGEGKALHKQNESLKHFNFVRKFVPFRRRSFEQVWRSFKNTGGAMRTTKEIDIPGTIQQLNRRGFIHQPTYQYDYKIRANVISFVDHKGSMLAYKHLANAILDSAETGAGVELERLYFYNAPQALNIEDNGWQNYVFKNKSHSQPVPLKKANPKQLPLLIISDAGAATGGLNIDRIKATEKFLRALYKQTHKIAWLNPIPQDRWAKTSADIICELVNMYEATEAGLLQAIKLWNGKTPPRSAILFPEMLSV